MKISIAMATYNGAMYIQEQLDSFIQQTRQPDELIVSDDSSTDRTLEIVKEFAKSAPFPVRVFQNKENLGYTKNFEVAIQKCSGDLVFLSDQDDVWLAGKLARIEEEFAKDSSVLLVINDTEIALGDLSKTGLTKLSQVRALGLNDERFITGCCSAFSRDLVELFIPVPEEFVHDTWLHKLAHYLGVRKVVPEVLQIYRRHDSNTSDWLATRTTRLSGIDLFNAYQHQDPKFWCSSHLDKLQTLFKRFEQLDKSEANSQPFIVKQRLSRALEAIVREQQATHNRLNLLRKRTCFRLIPAFRMFIKGDYNYFSGWKSFAKDLIK